MEGRWTIRLDHAGNELAPAQPEPSDQIVPVVPCNDAAIERAARLLHRALGHNAHAWDTDGCACRENAEDMLRSAGETP